MQRITELLRKIEDLAQRGQSPLEIDLMMDYTRSLYAELIELQKNHSHITAPVPAAIPLQITETPAASDETVQDIPLEINMPQEYPKSQIAAELNNAATTNETAANHNEATPSQPQIQENKTIRLETRSNADIRKEIGINDKYLFISELFGNVKEAYDKVLSEINGIASYDDAVDYLDENVHEKHRWEDDNDTVQSFYSAVNRFFSSKK